MPDPLCHAALALGGLALCANWRRTPFRTVKLTTQAVLAFPVFGMAVVSHLVLDRVPHWDPDPSVPTPVAIYALYAGAAALSIFMAWIVNRKIRLPFIVAAAWFGAVMVDFHHLPWIGSKLIHLPLLTQLEHLHRVLHFKCRDTDDETCIMFHLIMLGLSCTLLSWLLQKKQQQVPLVAIGLSDPEPVPVAE